MPTTLPPEAAPRLRHAIERRLEMLNHGCGLPTIDDDAPITARFRYGYIGTVDRDGDHRVWYVFVPGNGAPTSRSSHLGPGHATDDVQGMAATLQAVQGAFDFAKWQALRS